MCVYYLFKVRGGKIIFLSKEDDVSFQRKAVSGREMMGDDDFLSSKKGVDGTGGEYQG